MKILYWVLGTLALVGMVWLMVRGFGEPRNIKTYEAGDPEAPQIEMVEKKFDYGKISVNDVATHEFTIKNTGKNTLMIADIATSCHCASAYFKVGGKRTSPEFLMTVDKSWLGKIEPGEVASLEVIYTPAKMPVNGNVSRVVSFTSNDPDNLENQLEVTADVQS